MDDRLEMPTALEVARAMAKILRGKLADHGSETIVLTREEAALCLGLAEGAADNLDQRQAEGR
jgi:hypothetical protein